MQTPVAPSGNLVKTIIAAGLLAGSLDIAGACLWAWLASGTTPDIILRYISGGLTGLDVAFKGGVAIIVIGLIIHYLIAFSWTILFLLAYPRIKIFQYHPMATAVGYGAFIWLVMNLIVLPMTKLPTAHPKLKGVLIGAGILIVAIGLPLSIIAGKFYKK